MRVPEASGLYVFCTLLILLLVHHLPACASSIKDPDILQNQTSKCNDLFNRRKARLENFKLRSEDSRQVRLFKYLSARSFNRPVPASALRSDLHDFRHLNKVLDQMMPETLHSTKTFEECYFNPDRPAEKDCQSEKLSSWKKYRENLQALRDLYIDCWNSRHVPFYYIDPRISHSFYPRNTNSSRACDEIFEITSDFPNTEPDQMLNCDNEPWKNLTRYEFICKRQPLIPVETYLNRAQIHVIGDQVSSLLNIPHKTSDPWNTHGLETIEHAYKSGDYDDILSGRRGPKIWMDESVPMYGIERKIMASFVYNETRQAKLKATQLLNRFAVERMHPSDFGLVDVIMNQNLGLLQFAKVVASTWRFKYVYPDGDKYFEMNMDNNKILGRFVANPEFPSDSGTERRVRLLNDYVEFYWDIMKTRGVLPERPAEEDYAVTCSYEPSSKFRKFDHTQDVIVRERDNRLLNRHLLMRLERRFLYWALIMTNLRESIDTGEDVLISADKDLELVRLAYITFKNTSSDIRSEVSESMLDLLLELWELNGEQSPVYYPNFLLDKDFILQCETEFGCKFRVALQILATAFELTYLNDVGDEVGVDGTGVFTYVPRDGEESEGTGRIRRLLNYLAQLVLSAKNAAVQ